MYDEPILSFFENSECTNVNLSLGGALVLRDPAAAQHCEAEPGQVDPLHLSPPQRRIHLQSKVPSYLYYGWIGKKAFGPVTLLARIFQSRCF